MKRKHGMIDNEKGGESELSIFRREWRLELSQNELYNDFLLATAIDASLADSQAHPAPLVRVGRQRLDPLVGLMADCLGIVLDHLPLPALAHLAQCSRAWADAVRRCLHRPGVVFRKPAWYQFDSSHAGAVPRSARVVEIGRCRVFDYDDFQRLPPMLERLSIDVSGEKQGLSLIASVPRGRLTRLTLTLGQVADGLDCSGLVPRLERFPELRRVKIWYHLPPPGSRDDVVWRKWEWSRRR